MKKIIYNGQMRNEHFLIVIYQSSLVKAAVNGLRICKLRRDRLTGTGHGATVFGAPLEYATTSHQFFIFQLSKAEQGPINSVFANYGGVDFSEIDKTSYIRSAQ
jgi:hypothetical protein